MRKPAAMIVAGVMSGTSADGVDVALVRVSPRRGTPKLEVLGHSEFAYPKAVRAAVLQAASGEMKTAELGRLNWKLGAVYAECVEKACANAGVVLPTSQNRDVGHPVLGLVGMHGQTVFHEAPGATWQIGEAAVVRERLRVPVVSDFRPADMAAGGQGAPLVPMLDYVLFRSGIRNRVMLNLGGIANMTVIPSGAKLEDVIAFDSGPANMVIDAVMQREFGKAFDRGGKTGKQGAVIESVLKRLMRDAYYAKLPPKSCGREQYGSAFAERLIGMCKAAGGSGADAVATATDLTAATVVEAYKKFGKGMSLGKTEVVAAGGGVRNELLMWRLKWRLIVCGGRLTTVQEFGVDPQAKEAVAFALLGWLSWHGLGGECAFGYWGQAGSGVGEDFVVILAKGRTQRTRWKSRKGAQSKAWSLLILAAVAGCSGAREDSRTVVMAIENSPTNLDRRIGTDAMSERIGDLIFDPLVRMDEHYEMQPWLATSWEQPDAPAGESRPWVFHLRDGVRFQDGRPLTAEDVVWTIESMRDGSLLTSKSGAFAKVLRAEVRDRLTVVVRMKEADASLLFNLSDSLFGVVPKGSGKDFGRRPVGSGPFRFVSQEQDKDVVIERNPDYWGTKARLERVRFAVIPDAVTVALELEKGSADIASNHLTLDMVHALEGRPGLATETGPGSAVMYLNFNVSHGPLKDVRVRQAIACAMNKPAMIRAVWRDKARLASTLLPVGHWAEAVGLPVCGYDPARARALLASAGFGNGLKLEMKTSQDDTTRLVAQILQAELRDVGIDLTLRSSEFGTFYSDVTAGRFEMYALRWIGSNEDPDIYRYAFASDRTPPKGANRGHYSNAKVDALLADAAATTDEGVRRAKFEEVQRILAVELPTVPLWYPNNEVVHTTRVRGIVPRVDGSFDFLRDAWVEGP